MAHSELVSMPWYGPTEPESISATYDAIEMVLFTDPVTFDPPPGPDDSGPGWLIEVEWMRSDDDGAWRPGLVAVRSTTGMPVNLTIWRAAPVSRAIRWSRALLDAKGKLAAQKASRSAADELRPRVLTVRSENDQRVYYDAEHWDRVREAWRAAHTAGRREIGEWLERKYPNVRDARGRRIYAGLNDAKDTRVKGWLQRLAQIDRNSD